MKGAFSDADHHCIALLVMFLGVIGAAIAGLIHTEKTASAPLTRSARPPSKSPFSCFWRPRIGFCAPDGHRTAGDFLWASRWHCSRSWHCLLDMGGRRVGGQDVIRGSVGLLGIAAVAVATYGLIPPYEAMLNASDASTVPRHGCSCCPTGALEAEDPLVAEMTPQERQTLFENRFPKDVTGPYARFPGGVRLGPRPRVGFLPFLSPVAGLARLGVMTIGSPDLSACFRICGSQLDLAFPLGAPAGWSRFRPGARHPPVLLLPTALLQPFTPSEVPAQAFFLAGCFASSGQSRRGACASASAVSGSRTMGLPVPLARRWCLVSRSRADVLFAVLDRAA